jgi:hypothetical protein
MIKILVCGYSDSIHFFRWCGFLRKASFSTDVLSFIKNREFDYGDQGKYFDFSSKSENRFVKTTELFFRFLYSILFVRRSDYDFINYNFLEFHLLVHALFVNKKIIITAWGSDILMNYRKSSGMKKLLFDAILRKASAITCDSQSVYDTITARCKKIDPSRIKTIYWGIDTGLFTVPDPDEKKRLRSKYKLPESSIVLLSIRLMDNNYRIKEIITWFTKNIADKRIYLFVRVPPKKNAAYFKECLLESRDNGNIIFNDEAIDYGHISEIYKISDIDLHFPMSDATPVSIFEGISCGNLIICSRDVESYVDLGRTYGLCLTTLDQLNQSSVLEYYEKKAALTGENIEKLDMFHSERKTVDSMKNIFTESEI